MLWKSLKSTSGHLQISRCHEQARFHRSSRRASDLALKTLARVEIGEVCLSLRRMYEEEVIEIVLKNMDLSSL